MNDNKRGTVHGHTHGEAFMLMAYACDKCCHRETIWNSRDGVTPFGTRCPSCGESSLRHENWPDDVYAPNHKPHKGQRFWRDGTPDEAEAIMRRRFESMKDQWPITPDYAEELVRKAREGSLTGDFQPGWPMLSTQP